MNIVVFSVDANLKHVRYIRLCFVNILFRDKQTRYRAARWATLTTTSTTTLPCLPVQTRTKPLPSPIRLIVRYLSGGTVTPGRSNPSPPTIRYRPLTIATTTTAAMRLYGCHNLMLLMPIHSLWKSCKWKRMENGRKSTRTGRAG